jgi:hypothetical protein
MCYKTNQGQEASYDVDFAPRGHEPCSCALPNNIFAG